MTNPTPPAGFTAVYCSDPHCPTHHGHERIVPTLRACVRTCPHGVLVATGCLHTGLRTTATCDAAPCPLVGHGNDRPAGPLVIVQPCDTRRSPHGRLVIAGPLHEPRDLAELCTWLAHGLPHGQPLPHHLHATA